MSVSISKSIDNSFINFVNFVSFFSNLYKLLVVLLFILFIFIVLFYWNGLFVVVLEFPITNKTEVFESVYPNIMLTIIEVLV